MFDKSAFSMVGSYLFQRNLTISVDKQLGYQSCSKQTVAKHKSGTIWKRIRTPTEIFFGTQSTN
jgi:hypothetical protein